MDNEVTFKEWLEETFAEYKRELPDYEMQMDVISTGNLRKAWDAGFKAGSGDSIVNKDERKWQEFKWYKRLI